MSAPAVLAVSGAPATLLVVLGDVVLILVAARLAGRLAARLGQPPVIGEILAGIALGPSLLGLLGADLPGTLFPDDARGWLKHVGDLGLVLFLFGVGRESDPRLLRRARGRIGALSVGSIVVPAAVGALVALPLWADHAIVDGQGVPRAAFAAFVAVALAVTAFPVLARILGDAGLLRSEVGRTAMAVAAVTDLVAWSALAVVVGIWGTGGRPVLELVLLVLAYGVGLRVVLLPVVRAALAWWGRRTSLVPAAILLAGLLVSAAATDRIGLHAAIGAFAFGVLCPREGAAGRAAAAGEDVLARTGVLLVPVFFLTTGLTVDLASLSLGGVSELLLLLVAASLAKFVGVAGAARLSGDAARPAAALGVLLNARGLTELVILEVGRSSGILDDRIFAALVAVALVTTVVTGPLFRRLHRGDGPAVARSGLRAHPLGP
jgi:Kef-type K+ transport system membrane component KefB